VRRGRHGSETKGSTAGAGGKPQAVIPSEDDEQTIVFQWAQYHEGRDPRVALLFHIPNGGARNIATAKRLKGLGVKSGVPDLFLPVAARGFHGLWIEMKRQRKGVISVTQLEWIEALRGQQYLVVVAKGAEEAIEALKQYLEL